MADGHATASVRPERGEYLDNSKNINASPENPGAGESCAQSATGQRGSRKPLYESPARVSADALLRQLALEHAIPIALSEDGAHVFVLMEMPGELYDHLASFQDDDPAGGNVDDEGEADEDPAEDDDPGGGNVEDEGEPSHGWPEQPHHQERLSAGSTSEDECEPSLGFLDSMMDQRRIAEGNRGDWTVADAEQEHDGRELDHAELGI